jgi:hypothetical protein
VCSIQGIEVVVTAGRNNFFLCYNGNSNRLFYLVGSAVKDTSFLEVPVEALVYTFLIASRQWMTTSDTNKQCDFRADATVLDDL